MYKVIEYFMDLEDGNHEYFPGDIFPREGLKVDEKRIAELVSDKNKRGLPLIKKAEENPAKK